MAASSGILAGFAALYLLRKVASGAGLLQYSIGIGMMVTGIALAVDIMTTDPMSMTDTQKILAAVSAGLTTGIGAAVAGSKLFHLNAAKSGVLALGVTLFVGSVALAVQNIRTAQVTGWDDSNTWTTIATSLAGAIGIGLTLTAAGVALGTAAGVALAVGIGVAAIQLWLGGVNNKRVTESDISVPWGNVTLTKALAKAKAESMLKMPAVNAEIAGVTATIDYSKIVLNEADTARTKVEQTVQEVTGSMIRLSMGIDV